MTKLMSTLAAAAAAISTSAIFASPAAYAAPADTDAPHARVSWQDLDLDTAAGRRALAHRTEAAARTVCPDAGITGSRLESPAASRCRAAVRTQVAAQVGTAAQVALRN